MQVGEGSLDFSAVMQLCSEVQQGRQTRYHTDADQNELAKMTQTVDELCHKMLKFLQGREVTPNRKDQYQWTILRVAVEEAIEIVADLVSFTLKFGKQQYEDLHSSPSSGCEMTSVDGQSTRSPQHQLESVLSLCRLDYCLLHFEFFLALQDNGHVGNQDDKQLFPEVPDTARTCTCRRSSQLSRADQVRSQTWFLVEKLRNEWMPTSRAVIGQPHVSLIC